MTLFLNRFRGLLAAAAAVFFLCSASAEEQAIDIEVMQAAVYRAPTQGCCSPSYLVSHGEDSLALRWCSTQGGYCNGSKRHPFLLFDLRDIPDDSQVTTVRLRGHLSGSSYAGGFLHYGFSDVGESSDSLATEIYLTPAGTLNLTWPSTTTFNLGMGSAPFNASGRARYLVIMLGTYHSSLSNIRNDPGFTSWVEINYETPELPCDGDVNDDDFVDGGDLSLVLGYWGSGNPTYDLDENGLIDGADLAIVLGEWGLCPEGE